MEEHPQPPKRLIERVTGWRAIMLDLTALALCFLAVGITIGVILLVRRGEGAFVGIPLLVGFTTAAILGLIAKMSVDTNMLIRETKATTEETHHIVNSQLTAFKEAIVEQARMEIVRQRTLVRAEGVEQGIQQERTRAKEDAK